MTVTSGVRVPAQRAVAADRAAASFIAMGGAFASPATGGRAVVREGVGLMVTGSPAPTLNAVVCARTGAVATAAAMLDELAATGLPYSFQTRSGDAAGEVLARSRGMSAAEEVPFMLLDPAPVAVVSDVAIRVLRADETDVHLDVVDAAFGMPAEVLGVFRGTDLVAREGVTGYVVEVDGVPVATTLGIANGAHVGVFDVATLPAYRGRGYGAALTMRAVADGVAAGATAAFLQSSAMGLPVYERCGFRTAEQWTVWIVEPAA